uniref:Uncharacterized protein TCIL3000_5_4190 n=1 Tax=Trypanosoma congolense (strain IL3000) TaxID=1068625 RepID=G0UM10_TRYCI|nr:unnamed protein product [Trypanosoma congolense IL3000]
MAALVDDVESLRKRLLLSEDWNLRLQNQIQELLRLPRNEVEVLRSRMYNPDIAIPLLQCYDATIVEKQEENEKLLLENQRLKSRLEEITSELNDMQGTVQETEELMKERQVESQRQQRCIDDVRLQAEHECAKIRQDLTRALEDEGNMRREVKQMQRQLAAAQEEAQQRQQEVAKMEEMLRITQCRLKAASGEKEETQQQHEVQRIQLQLLSKENEDKMQELERLRSRMVQALRQAAENHAAHMRIVEEKHREALEAIRAQLNTQELETQKLRAHLARVDTSAKGCKYEMGARSTTELLEMQTRQAQEIELKRLYTELSALQLQRDDALLRYEQLSSNLRREEAERASDTQREIQQLRNKLRELQQRHDLLEKEHAHLKEEARVLREKSKSHASDLQRSRQERDQAVRKVDDLRRALAAAEEACETAKREGREEAARERQRLEEQAQRNEDVVRELQLSKERALAAVGTAERQRDDERHKLAAAKDRLDALQSRLENRERETEVLNSKLVHMQEAVRLNQQQALACDERVQQLLAQDEEKTRQLREMKLLVERLKLESARATRACERLQEEVNVRVH